MIRNTTANSEYIFVFVVCSWDIYCGSQYRDEQLFGHVHSFYVQQFIQFWNKMRASR